MYYKFLMLIEDDIDDRHLFCQTLSDISPEIECLHFSNGLHALEYLKSAENLPEIIFTDLFMHLMDGNEFLEEVNKDDRLKSVPIYIYSTAFLISKMEDTLKESAAGNIFKTPDYSELEGTIQTVLNDHRLI
jgi:CheY-like chemotaxis protein